MLKWENREKNQKNNIEQIYFEKNIFIGRGEQTLREIFFSSLFCCFNCDVDFFVFNALYCGFYLFFLYRSLCN